MPACLYSLTPAVAQKVRRRGNQLRRTGALKTATGLPTSTGRHPENHVSRGCSRIDYRLGCQSWRETAPFRRCCEFATPPTCRTCCRRYICGCYACRTWSPSDRRRLICSRSRNTCVQQHSLRQSAAPPSVELSEMLNSARAVPDMDPVLDLDAQQCLEQLQSELDQLLAETSRHLPAASSRRTVARRDRRATRHLAAHGEKEPHAGAGAIAPAAGARLSHGTTSSARLNAQIYSEAAEWFVNCRSGALDDATRRKFDAWLRQSPQHLSAYLELAAIWDEASERWMPSVAGTPSTLMAEARRRIRANVIRR